MVALPEPYQHTVIAIWDAYEQRAASNGGDSRGINMGSIANECERALWYALRWANAPERITGVKQRRFDTGNLEEERLLADLEAAGIAVESVDPTTGAQFRVELAEGWLRGKMDGRATNVPEAPKTVHVIEIKSHNDKSFKDLSKRKLKDAKPDHYAQCMAYMRGTQLTRCLYLAVNKNTDELYAERVHYDAPYATRLEAKARRIVAAYSAPAKLFEDPTSKAAYQCQWCSSADICHAGEFARVNCRTCISAEFLPGAVVRCVYWDKELTYDEQQRGCPKHLYLPSLVPGDQVDANESERWVQYLLRDGTEWIDRGAIK